MRDEVAIVESATAQVEANVRAAFAALREAEVQLAKAEKRVESARGATAMRRLELGKALIAARAEWPERGPRASGWGRFLAREGLSQSTAWRHMRDAGYQGEEDYEISFTDDVVNEINPTITGDSVDPPTDPGPPATPDTAPVRAGFDLRLGRWEAVLADIGMVDLVLTDTPFGARTHESEIRERSDGVDVSGLRPDFECWTPDDIAAFVAHWSPRCRGWMVALTSHDLCLAWEGEYERAGRYSFAPVPCVINGMTVRMRGDGPSSWAVYAMVARPRTPEFYSWGTLRGAYVGNRSPGAGSGRGKPSWLTDALVRDYSRDNDLVCDPLAGFGGTLISALDAGRRAVGAEIDHDAHDEAYRRAAAPPEEHTEA